MDIPLSSDALDIDFHPGEGTHLLAAGLISGKVQLVSFAPLQRDAEQRAARKAADRERKKARGKGKGKGSDEEEDEEEDAEDGNDDSTAIGKKPRKLYQKLWASRPSSKSCRGLHFDHDGSSIWSISKDRSIVQLDTETGKVKSHWQTAHDAAPSRILPLQHSLLCTGDDDGVIKLWDPRKAALSSSIPASSSNVGAEVRAYEHHFDWITDLLWCEHLAQPKPRQPANPTQKQKEKLQREREEQRNEMNAVGTGRNRLVCTSGDGTLSVIDIRGTKTPVEVSEDQEDELLSVAAIKGGNKLVVGTQLGMLSLWAPARGLLDHVDRIPGHPSSVDALVTLDADTLLTGSSDGLVRVVQVLPHKLLGVVADHEGMPVERLRRKERWLASIGHGSEVKMTDVGPLLEDDDSGEEDGEDEEEEERDDSDDEDGEQTQGITGAALSVPSLAPTAPKAVASAASASDDDDDDNDSDSDSDSDAPSAHQRPFKKQKQRKELGARGPASALGAGGGFFDDL